MKDEDKPKEQLLTELQSLRQLVLELKTSTSQWQQAAETLRKAHHELDLRIQERTAKLEAVNEALQQEIAKRKRIERALRESEEQYRKLVETMNDGLGVQDENGLITYVNNRLYDMFGYSQDEMVGRPVTDLLDKTNQRILKEHILRRRDGERTPYELAWTRKDGQQISTIVSPAPILDAEGRFKGSFAVITDITERKQIEKTLRQVNNELECRVEERTAELSKVNLTLREEIAERKRAQKTLQQYTQRLEILNKISRAILAAQSPQAIAQAALDYLQQLIPCRRISIMSVDFEADQVTLLAINVDDKTGAGQKMDLSLKKSKRFFEELKQGQVNVVEDLLALRQLTPMQQTLLADGVRTYINVPLIARAELIGSLNLGADQAGFFTLEHLHIAREVADQLAVAIQQARLHEAEQLARQTAEALCEANMALTQTLDLNVVLETLLDYLSRLVSYDRANIMLLQPDSRLVIQTSRGYTCPPVLGQLKPIAIDPQIYPLIHTPLVTQQKALILKAKEYCSREARAGLTHGRNWLSIPLVAGGKAIGVCMLDKKEPVSFTPEQLRIAEALAAQAAVAIQNAQLFSQVRTGQARLQTLAQRLVEVQETERRYIARELHDEIGQLLTGLKLTLESGAGLPLDETRGKLNKAQGLVNELMACVRQLSLDLQPMILADLGLLPALLWHFERYTRQTNVQVHLKHTGIEQRFAAEVETTAYRIVQEALTNVARHAGVSEAMVQLWADQELLIVQIEDQGIGFEAELALTANASSGLYGMRERATLLGGHLLLESAPAKGTRLTVELPLPVSTKKRSVEHDYDRISR